LKHVAQEVEGRLDVAVAQHLECELPDLVARCKYALLEAVALRCERELDTAAVFSGAAVNKSSLDQAINKSAGMAGLGNEQLAQLLE
jgi:hypothetical protein